ncbi:MAG: trypsin-like peptidase domain-containing protein [Flavobacteriales bacterium]|nr:trypsin-like peptidase domain-containing protein [Flavobacteriales bacterium]
MSVSRQTQFISATEGTRILISKTEDGPFEEVGSANPKVKLNHFHKKGYFVKQEKEGYVSGTYELARSSTNGLNRLDMALVISAGAVAAIFTPIHFLVGTNPPFGADPKNVSLGQTVALYSTIGVALAGWGIVIPAPRKLYPKKVELPELIKIVTKDTNQLSLSLGKFEMELGKSKVRVEDYTSMKQFKSGRGYDTRDSAVNFEFSEKADLKMEVQRLLREAKYGVDSVDAVLNKTLRIEGYAQSVSFQKAENQLRCELRTAWSVETLDEIQFLYGWKVTSGSEWVKFNEESLDEDEQQGVIRLAMNQALDISLKKFLALDTIQSILSRPVPLPLLDEPELELVTGAVMALSVSDAVKSVVTVVNKKGHGSGCIVTPDGYIITNAHVVEDDTVGIKVILTEDTEQRIPVKLVRMNKALDLALLKLDTTGLMPLKLCADPDIVTGSDVYAIGTPADVSLGQTVTRGIISGKRKFGGHSRIQTDVGISPGNSGGALINPNGLLLGVVTSQLRKGKVDNIGFAIPSPIIEEALKIKLNQ